MLRGEDYPGFYGWDLNVLTSPYKREAGGDHTHRSGTDNLGWSQRLE